MLVEGLGDGVTGVLVVSVSVAEVVASGSSVSVTGSVVVMSVLQLLYQARLWHRQTESL